MLDKCNKLLTRFRSVADAARRTPVGKATGRVKVGTVVFRHLQIALLATRNRITPILQLRLVTDGADSFVTLEGKTPHLLSHSSASETCQIKRRFFQPAGGIMEVLMTLTLPLEPQEEAKLVAAARARGVSLDALVREALGRIFSEAATEAPGKEPTRSLRGLLAKYGPAPSAEEIDQNRAEMFANFPRSDF